MLTPEQIAQLGLAPNGMTPSAMADGSHVKLINYDGLLPWFGTERPIQVLAGGGKFALIGVGLLEDLELHIDYPARLVKLSLSPAAMSS